MTEYVTGSALASYLERDQSAALDNVADRTNALVDEEWSNPSDPAPQWVVNIAWNVAIRAGRNPLGVTSTTRSFDDITRTDRWEAGQPEGVFLTDDERRLLNNDGAAAPTPILPARSIRMSVPPYSTPPYERWVPPWLC